MTFQPGTSWASPSVSGAAALVRQYFTDGYYPSGTPKVSDRMTPSAALLKAMLIASARRVPFITIGGAQVASKPTPSNEQGFGFPVLADALYFPGDAVKLRVVDVLNQNGLEAPQTATTQISVRSGSPLKAVLVWTDPPGSSLVNDLDLRVDGPEGNTFLGNGQPDHVNNVEVVSIAEPLTGTYNISVSYNAFIGRQGYALVITGDISDATVRSRAARH
jgi:hypothetical protein